MTSIQASRSNIETEKADIGTLIQYKSHVVSENKWRGRLVTAGIVAAAVLGAAIAAGLIFFGVVTINPLLLGLGIALGACVLVGSFSLLGVYTDLPDKALKQIRPVANQQAIQQPKQEQKVKGESLVILNQVTEDSNP